MITLRKPTTLLLALTCTAFLSGCIPAVEKVCGYKKDYASPYYNNYKCGPKITYRCDRICDKCHATGEVCKACWACINSECCGTDCNY